MALFCRCVRRGQRRGALGVPGVLPPGERAEAQPDREEHLEVSAAVKGLRRADAAPLSPGAWGGSSCPLTWAGDTFTQK